MHLQVHQPHICFKPATTQTSDTGVTIVSSNMNSETKKYAIFVNVTEHSDHSIETVFSHWMFICNHVKYGIKIYMECLFYFACSKILTCISERLYMSNRSLQLGIAAWQDTFLLQIQMSCGTLRVCLWKKMIWQSNIICGICAGQLGNGTRHIFLEYFCFILVQSHTSPCRISGRQSGDGRCISLNILVSPSTLLHQYSILTFHSSSTNTTKSQKENDRVIKQTAPPSPTIAWS
jgi:hypothetical protein